MTVVNEIVDAHKEVGQAIIDIDKQVKGSIDIGKAILSGNYGKTSIVRLTKDQIMQFPIIMSMDIDNDEKRPIIKAIERNYATLVLMGILNTGRVDWDKYDSINDFLREFHDNYDVKISTEAFDVVNAIVNEGYMDENTAMELWESIEDQLDSDLINDMYLPFKRTNAKLIGALEGYYDNLLQEVINEIKMNQVRVLNGLPEIHTAEDKAKTEIPDLYDAYIKKSNTFKRVYTGRNKAINEYQKLKKEFKEKVQDDVKIKTTNLSGHFTRTENKKRREFEKQEKEKERKFRDEERQLAENHAKDMAQINHENRLKEQEESHQLRMREKANTGEMLQEDKFSAMMPSLLRLEITATKTGVGDWRQGLYVGIKAMPRYIKSSLLVSNMVEALQNRTIFKFIKWTKEELKWYDLLFDLSNAKEESLGKNKWLKALARRSKTNQFRRYITGKGWNPNVTIIITEAEAHEVQSVCGISLFNPNNVRRIIDKYFLLGFGIYDTEGKILKMMYDSEDNFTGYSLRHLMTEAKRDLNLLSLFKY